MKALQSFLSIFKSSTGNYDLGRIMAFKVITCFNLAFLWAIFKLHQNVNWAEAGAGYAAVMTGCVALIGLKEVAVAKANSLNATQP